MAEKSTRMEIVYEMLRRKELLCGDLYCVNPTSIGELRCRNDVFEKDGDSEDELVFKIFVRGKGKEKTNG